VLFGGEDVESEAAPSPVAFDWELKFEKQANALACEYWQSRCNGRPMPKRADLDPVAMKKFSPHVGLIELHQAPGGETGYFVRRSGSRLDEIYGPITGRNMDDFLPPPLSATWREMLEAPRQKLAPVRTVTRVDFEGKTWLNVEMLLAPLGEDGKVDMIFLTLVAWTKETL
jgi:hypothetical protein